MAVAGGGFFIADFMDFVPLGWRLAWIPLVSASVVLFFLISRFDSAGWLKLALVLGSVSIALCLGELVFRVFLLRPYVPSSDAEFDARI